VGGSAAESFRFVKWGGPGLRFSLLFGASGRGSVWALTRN